MVARLEQPSLPVAPELPDPDHLTRSTGAFETVPKPRNSTPNPSSKDPSNPGRPDTIPCSLTRPAGSTSLLTGAEGAALLLLDRVAVAFQLQHLQHSVGFLQKEQELLLVSQGRGCAEVLRGAEARNALLSRTLDRVASAAHQLMARVENPFRPHHDGLHRTLDAPRKGSASRPAFSLTPLPSGIQFAKQEHGVQTGLG
eukprot:2639218-Rhodomonas_salina.1